MVINFHTHCFPDKIAGKAMSALNFSSGGLMPHTDGTYAGILREMEEENVDLSVCLSIATNTHQQTKVNDFAHEINGGKTVAFGSVHPDSENVFEELERIKELGLSGIKLHPEFQNFFVDDDKMKPIYKKISELGLITVFHAGADLGYTGPVKCTPERLEKALSWFDAPVVAAHWGGISCYDEVVRRLCGKDIYFDTSFGYRVIPKPYAEMIIEKHGTDRILFGSDSPWSTPSMERRLIDTLSLTEGEKMKIYGENAKKLLRI